MSAANNIIERARTLGVSLRVDDGKIKVKGQRPSVERLMPDIRAHKPELVRLLSLVGIDPDETSGHWLVFLPARKLEKYFTPDISRAELQRLYPGALLI